MERLLTVHEAAKMLNVSPYVIRSLCRQYLLGGAGIKSAKIRQTWRIKKSDLEIYIAEQFRNDYEGVSDEERVTD